MSAIAGSLHIPVVMSYNTDITTLVTTWTGRSSPALLACIDQAGIRCSQVIGIFDVQCIIAVSHGSLANLTQRGLIPAGQCTDVMLPIVNTTIFRPVRPQPRLFKEDGSLRVVFCGRLGPEKRVNLLIESLRYTRHAVQLLIIGDGEHMSCLEKQAAIADVGRGGSIRFVGAVEHHLLASYYCAADVYLSASDFETCGLTTLEAMACGLPALLVPHGGAIDHLQSGRTGIACRTPQEFAAAMDHLHDDQALCKRMARSAQNYARGCTIHACGEHLLSRYRKVIRTFPTTIRTEKTDPSSKLWSTVATLSRGAGLVKQLIRGPDV